MPIEPKDVKIVLRETGRTVRHGKRRRQETTLKDYNVLAPDGSIIGVVMLKMQTFEQKTPGRVYVNSRWESPRWFRALGDSPYGGGRYWSYFETRKQAVEALLHDYNEAKEAVG